MMRYTGPNAEGFARDARMLLEYFRLTPEAEQEQTMDEAARALARDYGIGEAEVWDVLPEYEEQSC